jgi:hypothetical protein
MTPAELDRVDDVTFDAMVRFMEAEAAAIRSANRKR